MGPRVSDTGVLTTVSFALIASLAVLTIIGILWGMRLKRARRAADRTEQERVEREGGTLPDPHAGTPLTDNDATDLPPAARTVAPAPPATNPAPIVERPAVVTPAAPPSPEPHATEPEEPAPAPDPLVDEPVAAAASLDASPAAEAQPAAPEPPAAPAGPPPGDAPLTRIKGLGPKVAARLAELGITNIGQLAALDTRAAQDLDAHLGPFTGRMTRDRWLEQAQLLANGDVKGFEERFGRL